MEPQPYKDGINSKTENKMKKSFGFVAVLALALVLGFGSDTHASVLQGDYLRCVEVSSADYPSGWYCPSESAREREINLIKAKIAYLQAQLVELQASL